MEALDSLVATSFGESNLKAKPKEPWSQWPSLKAKIMIWHLTVNLSKKGMKCISYRIPMEMGFIYYHLLGYAWALGSPAVTGRAPQKLQVATEFFWPWVRHCWHQHQPSICSSCREAFASIPWSLRWVLDEWSGSHFNSSCLKKCFFFFIWTSKLIPNSWEKQRHMNIKMSSKFMGEKENKKHHRGTKKMATTSTDKQDQASALKTIVTNINLTSPQVLNLFQRMGITSDTNSVSDWFNKHNHNI